jgi:lipase ATG15
MHLSVATSILSYLYPFLPQPPITHLEPAVVTFRPVHAHAHAFHNTSTQPTLLFHNVTAFHSLTDIPNMATFSDIDSAMYLLDNPNPEIASQPLSIRTRPQIIRRPRIPPPSMIAWSLSARHNRLFPPIPLPIGTYASASRGNTSDIWLAPDMNDLEGDWEDVEVLGPDVTDRQTLITLAKMTSNAYVLPDSGEWWNTDGWNETMPFGWETDADGLRGHVVG